eukprot:m.168449 g.168449  ORF g.168449 m.168449 type:complete len:195 (+) comp53202_c0_seq2:99-683(+)
MASRLARIRYVATGLRMAFRAENASRVARQFRVLVSSANDHKDMMNASQDKQERKAQWHRKPAWPKIKVSSHPQDERGRKLQKQRSQAQDLADAAVKGVMAFENSFEGTFKHFIEFDDLVMPSSTVRELEWHSALLLRLLIVSCSCAGFVVLHFVHQNVTFIVPTAAVVYFDTAFLLRALVASLSSPPFHRLAL